MASRCASSRRSEMPSRHSKTGRVMPKIPGSREPETTAPRFVSAFLLCSQAVSALPLRVPHAMAPLALRLRKFGANAHTTQKGLPGIRRATLQQEAQEADGSDWGKLSREWPEKSSAV